MSEVRRSGSAVQIRQLWSASAPGFTKFEYEQTEAGLETLEGSDACTPRTGSPVRLWKQ